jgi:hypothetical protein
MDASAIMQRLNTMPCAYPVASAEAVMDKARVLGLKRPEGWMRAKKQTAKPRTWTQERLDLLHNLVNLIPDEDLRERLNALPGPTIPPGRAMRARAQELGYLAERPRKSGPNQGTWTESRVSFLRENYGRIPPAQLLVALQAMPGPAIAKLKTVRSAAVRLSIKSAGLVRPPPAPRAPRAASPRPPMESHTPDPAPRPLTIEEQEANVLAKWARIEEQAMKRFARGESPATVSGALRIYLREAWRLHAIYREQQKEAA